MERSGRSAMAGRRGSALLAAMILVGALAVLLLSLLATGVSGTRSVAGQDDDLRLTGAVESAGSVAADHIWSAYLRSQGGAAGNLASFRTFLDGFGIPDSGPGPLPPADAGIDVLPDLGLPIARGSTELDRVKIQGLHVARQDDAERTELVISGIADSNRGGPGAKPQPTRAAQIVYTVEPAPFPGFDYGILSNNIDCVFCHTVIDSAPRAYDTDPRKWGTFDKVKVACLETLMLRVPARAGNIGDSAADSLLAGTLYTRGTATDQHGNLITDAGWETNTAQSSFFDAAGHLLQDAAGNLIPNHFLPQRDSTVAGANLYLGYATNYANQADGPLPASFPPPFPDDGGNDPNHTGAGNRKVDPDEFAAVAQNAHGRISGTIYLGAPGVRITTPAALARATTVGNRSSLDSTAPAGNVILTGTVDHPIVIDGTVAIQGDVMIQGWIKGTGTILASGNVYVPGDLRYLDGRTYLPDDPPGHPSGPVTFGIAQDGTQNTLGLAAGGNVMVGDYLRPASWGSPGPDDMVNGTTTGGWNFSLAEISIFNRSEWAHTQPLLCGANEDPRDPSTWTVQNPGYIPDYVPRYYQFGPGDAIPIFNLADLHYDPAKMTWIGAEMATDWDPNFLTIVDPSDHTNPILYDPRTGDPRATVLEISPQDGWISDAVLKGDMQSQKAARQEGDPMRLDGLYYTNNAIFGIVARDDRMKGKLVVDGSLVCADLGLLAPGNNTSGGADTVPGSPFSVGLRLNYDERTKSMLNVTNPNQVMIRRALWRPTAAP